jgi:hypothetical protein
MDLGYVGGDSAVDFAVEEFDDLRTALLKPSGPGDDFASVVKEQGIGKGGVGVRLGLVVVDGVGASAAATYAGAQFSDVEEIEETLVVLFGGELGGRLQRWSLCGQRNGVDECHEEGKAERVEPGQECLLRGVRFEIRVLALKRGIQARDGLMCA